MIDIDIDIDIDQDQDQEQDYSQERLSSTLLRKERDRRLASITVDVGAEGDKLTFDANERSRNLISQAVNASETLGMSTTSWKMADNTWKEVTLNQLREASAVGLVRHGEIMGEYP